MNPQQMLEFAREQLTVYSSTSQMGVFLQNIIDMLDNPKTTECAVGNIVKRRGDVIIGVLLDKCLQNAENEWYVLTELGCIERWNENEVDIVGSTQKVKHLINFLQQ